MKLNTTRALTQLSHRYGSDTRKPQKTGSFQDRFRFVVLKVAALPRALGIDRLDTDVLASVLAETQFAPFDAENQG
jgi:hypothetical protein